MRQTVTPVACLLLLALIGPSQLAPSQSAEAEIRQVHADLIRGYMHNDAVLLDRILADEYTFIDADGRFLTKPHIVESFRSGDHHVFAYDMSEESIRIYGAAAVMTYRYVAKESYKGRRE